jgi:hypothetical protein
VPSSGEPFQRTMLERFGQDHNDHGGGFSTDADCSARLLCDSWMPTQGEFSGFLSGTWATTRASTPELESSEAVSNSTLETPSEYRLRGRTNVCGVHG